MAEITLTEEQLKEAEAISMTIANHIFQEALIWSNRDTFILQWALGMAFAQSLRWSGMTKDQITKSMDQWKKSLFDQLDKDRQGMN